MDKLYCLLCDHRDYCQHQFPGLKIGDKLTSISYGYFITMCMDLWEALSPGWHMAFTLHILTNVKSS